LLTLPIKDMQLVIYKEIHMLIDYLISKEYNFYYVKAFLKIWDYMDRESVLYM